MIPMRRTILAMLAATTLLALAARPAHAGSEGIGEAGVGVAMPVADGGYRQDFSTSPALWLGGVYLPGFGSRVLGIELGFEWTRYFDEFEPPNGARTDFSRYRIQLGGRYFRPLTPQLVGFAHALAGVEIFAWTQKGNLGTVSYEASDEHVGLAFDLSSGVMYQVGKIALSAQVALPIGVHRQDKHDGSIEINQTSFDLELRLTIGTRY